MLENLKFDHSQDDFVDAIGLKQRDYEIASMTIKYNLFCPLVIALRDGDEENGIEIPEGATSKSGILQRTLERLEGNQGATICALLLFTEQFSVTKKSLKDYISLAESGSPEEFFSSVKEKIAIKGESLSEALGHLGKLLALKPVAAALSFLKESNMDYDKFIAFTVDMVSYQDALEGKTEPSDDDEEDNGKDYGDIDDLIRKAFSRKDEE